MTATRIKHDIKALIARMDELGKGYVFFTEENEENFAEVRESLVIGLDELEEIIEGDEALKDALSTPEE